MADEDGAGRVWALSGVIAVMGALVYLVAVHGSTGVQAAVTLPWWALAGLFFLSEVGVVHVEFRGNAHTFSMNEIPLVVGLFFAAPAELVLAQLVGAGLALAAYRRQPPVKLAFNLGQLCLQACLAVLVFGAIVGERDPFGPVGWGAAFLVAWLALVVSDGLINTAIRLSGGAVSRAEYGRLLVLGTGATVTNTSLALIGVTILSTDPQAAFLLAVPIFTAAMAYRLYLSERRTRQRVDTLHESSLAAQSADGEGSVFGALLEQTRRMFQAEIAELTILGQTPGRAASVALLGPGDQAEALVDVELDPADRVREMLEQGQGVLLSRPIADPDTGRALAARGIRDAIAAPILAEGRVAGMLLVANRQGDVSTFDAWDLKLCETLAGSVSLSVENARVADLTESVALLTDLNRVKDDFVAMVSHELRTPLTSIQGYVKTLLRDDVEFDAEEQRSFLESIDRQSARLRHMIEDLLVVSRLESGRDRAELTYVSLPAVTRQILEDMRSRTVGHTVLLSFDEALPLVKTEHDKVQQIVSNLIENAAKYSPSGTTITVDARADADGIVLRVEDEGDGIPADIRDRIFDRFFQVDGSSTRRVGGVGLGLYICRRLAAAIGGDLSLERSDERGSAFSLRVPHVHPSAADGSVTGGHGAGGVASAVAGSPGRAG